MESPYLASVYEYRSWILDFFAERKHKNECKEDWEQYFLELPTNPTTAVCVTGKYSNGVSLCLVWNTNFSLVSGAFFPKSRSLTTKFCVNKTHNSFIVTGNLLLVVSAKLLSASGINGHFTVWSYRIKAKL